MKMSGGETSQSDRKQADPSCDPNGDADSADTVMHPSDMVDRVSDVVLAESETPKDVSDVVLAESETVRAPSFRAPSPPANAPSQPPPTIELRRDEKKRPRDQTPMAMLPGAKVDDFEIVRLLGRGAFGHVYLARQLSL